MSSIAPSSQSKLRGLIPPSLKGKWGIVGILFIVCIPFNLAWTYFHWGGAQNITAILNLISLSTNLLAAAAIWLVVMQKSLSLHIRRAWLLLALSSIMLLIGNLSWSYLTVVLDIRPFPSISDAFYLAFYPLALGGFLAMPNEPQNRRGMITIWLDLLSVFLVATMFVGYFIIGPTAATSDHDLPAQLVASAYPIGSLLLMAGILAVLYRRPSPDTQSALSLVLIGMIFFLSSDFAFSYARLHGTYTPGTWIDAGWNVAPLFFGLAALLQMVTGSASGLTTRWWIITIQKLLPWLPIVGLTFGYGLVFYVVIVNNVQAAVWLIDGALLLTLLIIGRQIISPAFANLPVRFKMILTFILVSLLSVILVFAMVYLTIRTNLESVMGKSLKSHAAARAESIGSLLTKQSDELEGFVLDKVIQDQAAAANAVYGTDFLPSIWDELSRRDLAWNASAETDPLVQNVLNNESARELHKFRARFPGYIDLLLTDKYGAVLAATARPTTYDQSVLSWWQGAVHRGQASVYISQPIPVPGEESRQLIIVIPVHAHLGSGFVGLLMATYNLKDMMPILAADGSGVGDSRLMLPTGQMLTSGNQFVFPEQETLNTLQQNADKDFAFMNFEGKYQLVSQALVTPSNPENASAVNGLNWTLIAYEESSTAFAPLFAVSRATLLILLFVLFLTSGVAVILSQVLIAPISRLTRVASQIAAGNLTAQVEVESNDEIGTLASTFNMMVQALSQTRQKLEENEALYHSLVDYSPDMILVHRDGKVLFVNPAGVKLIGAKSANEIVNQPLLDILHQEDRELVEQRIKNTGVSREPNPLIEHTMHRLDGTSFEAEFRAIPISYSGEPAIQFMMRDITERKRLEEQWQKFKLGIEHSTDAVFMTDVDGTIRYVNPAFENLYGYFWDEAVGQTPRILKSGKISQEAYQQFWETLLAKGSTRGELVNRTKDDRLIHIEGSTTPILDQDGSLVGFLAVQRDVTERKQAEEKIHQLLAQVARQRGDLECRVAQRTEELNTLNQRLQNELIERQQLVLSLRDSEERFRLLFEASPDAILLIDPNAQSTSWPIVDCNEAACTMNGYLREELIGKSVDLINSAPGDFAEREEYLEFLRQQGVLHRDGFHRHKDGHVFPIEVSSSIISFAERELVLGIDRDVTERKRSEEALRLSEEKYRHIFQNVQDVFYTADPQGLIVTVSPSIEKHSGYHPHEVVGKSVRTFFANPEDYKQLHLVAARQGILNDYESAMKRKDGSLINISVTARVVLDEEGRPMSSQGVIRDISERKQAEEDLKHAKHAAEESQRAAEAASQAKSEFLSRMSHELRTPMNAILGFAQLLEMSHKEPLSSSQKERVKQITKGGQHLLDLINEILDISRIEANRMQISPEPVSIRESIQEVLDLATPLAVKRHIQVVTKLGNSDVNPFVMADRQRLKQVLLNLLGNAVKYNYDGGSVIVTCLSTPANQWRISITDTGPGISQENQARLFVPFERLNADQPNVEGTGLGLVLAKRLVEMMRGQIGVESIVGRGSTFWVELPSTESPVERLERMGGTGALAVISTRARKILYIEDNVANFELIQEVLADHSQVKLLWASDAKTGIEMTRERQPSLVLLDLHLGDSDGAEVLRQLKQDKKTAGIPVIVVSADATSGQIERLTSLGAQAYLTKPLNVKHFVQLMQELLSEKVM